MDVDEIASFAEALGPVIREFVEQATRPLRDDLTAARAQIEILLLRGSGVKGTMRAQNGNLVFIMADGSREDIGSIDGANGRDADMDQLRSWIADETKTAVAAIELPAIDPDDVAAKLVPLVEDTIRGQVGLAVAAMPPPADGKDVDLDWLDQTIDTKVTERVAAIPAAKDGINGENGRDADPAEVAIAVRAELEPILTEKIAVLGIPSGVTPEALSLEIDAAIEKRLAETPTPEPVDPAPIAELVRAVLEPALTEFVERQIAALPAPEAGKDADPNEVAAAVREALEPIVVREIGQRVDEAVAALPPAPAGKDADPEALAVVNESLAAVSRDVEALKALPVAPVSLTVRDGDLMAIWADGEEKVLGHVQGRDGKDGADGKRGASTMDGSVDENGLITLRMSDGRRVTLEGSVLGPAGRDGSNGLDGKSGRDAVEISILPGIDEARRYPARTFAFAQGGILHAERETDPIEGGDVVKAGWTVAVRGLMTLTDEPTDDGRFIERIQIMTGGERFVTRIKTANMIYRGVWKDNRYDRGDVVSRGGSTWHCERETDQQPGTSPDWTLSVKRGRDGRETVSTKVISPVKHDGAA